MGKVDGTLYHFTDIKGLLGILSSNTMELCELSSIMDIRKVCFTTNDSLWVHGEWRIEFKSSIHSIATINQWDYDKSFGQYALEEEWFSEERIIGVREHIKEITNSAESVFIDVGSTINKNKERLYNISRIVLDYGLSSEFYNMWHNIREFYNEYNGEVVQEKLIAYIDNDEIDIIDWV